MVSKTLQHAAMIGIKPGWKMKSLEKDNFDGEEPEVSFIL